VQHNVDTLANQNYTEPLDPRQFAAAAARYPLFVVNFFAPWCPFCKQLAPTWETVMQYAHTKYPVSDGRIRLASVDCTAQEVRAIPSLLLL
jgi:thiol-disulfide isomerase/thioredoxin